VTDAVPTRKHIKILIVDDEPRVLVAIKRFLDRVFDVSVADNPREGLDLLAERTFHVVIADLKMPLMDGLQFLERAARAAPDTVRVLATGHADLDSAIAAINQGHVYRFLRKPFRPEILLNTINAAIVQHELIVAERVLLEETLHGALKAMIDLLGVVNPEIFGRATSIKKMVLEVAEAVPVEVDWQVGVAAMLSQIGHVTLPAETAARVFRGDELTSDEEVMVRRVPEAVEHLLGNIPRLEGVRDILAHQDVRYDGRSGMPGRRKEQEIPVGARLLKVALDFDKLRWRVGSVERTIEMLQERAGWYDPEILTGAVRVFAKEEDMSAVQRVRVKDLELGMVLLDDIRSEAGMVLLGRGQEVTPAVLARIQNYWGVAMGEWVVEVLPVPLEPESSAEVTARA
jgi:response regulator RpfG family c-di-GMP phosphodiesterase